MKNTVKLCTLALLCAVAITGCKKKEDDEPADTTPKNLGWNGTDNVSTVPTSVTNANLFSTGTLPAQVDLLPHFPPVGDQGQYGTCVAWASGYNMKTVIDGIQANLTAAQLASPANQSSPKDLFWSLADAKKGADCNGTNFVDAMDLLLNRGVATLQTVPYTSLGNCSNSGVQQSWTTEANQRKIKNYRKISPTVTSIKEQLANNFPVVIGAKLSDNFMTWNSDAVYNANSTYNQVGQHAYHALIISGYDDSKGANGAFRVVNSWNATWGDVGYVWMDYDFLVNQFVFDQNFYIATTDGGTNPPSPTPTPTTGVDLATWVFGDESNYLTSGIDNERVIYYNLYNIGSATAAASSNWSMYYVYFNAYDANDYGVLLYDEFNTSIATNTYVIDANNPNHITINMDLPANSDLGTLGFGSSSLYQVYYTPQNLNGSYYLVLVADAEGAFDEGNEQNNFFYTTGQSPKYFVDGYSARTSSAAPKGENLVEYKFINNENASRLNLTSNRFNTIVSPQAPNAYTSQEIGLMLKNKKRSGDLAQKVLEFKARQHKGGFGGK